MKLARKHLTRRRVGFTLIELMVVIIIILILIGLVSGAVMKALKKGPQVVNKNTITQLSDAVGAFQTKYNVPYVPSRIILCERFADYAALPAAVQPLAQDSIEYLTRVWPRLNTPNGPWFTAFVNWDGSTDPVGNPTYSPPVILEGDQCLVFFLGGIPSTGGPVPSVQGFSTNPADPSAPGVDRVGPFYDFKATQLVILTPAGPLHPNAALFFSCADAYAQTNNGTLIAGNVYAYFSAYKTANGYNRYGGTDCPSLPSTLGSGTWPYLQAAGKFFNPNSFQIISAGADFYFGSGSTGPAVILAPGVGTQLNVTLPFGNVGGKDDQCNFYDGLLGSY
jgi:prepilin-type N-terminal cleavage/methylation domain-containing protein